MRGDIEDVWERHTRAEFVDADVDATMATMTEDPTVVHVATCIGARGRDPVRAFYRDYFIGHQGSNMEQESLSRTVTPERLVDELRISFDHDIVIPWILPGITPTGRRVTVPVAAIVELRGGLVHSEHIYWDQASILAQIGLLDPARLPIISSGQADAVAENAPAETLNRLLG